MKAKSPKAKVWEEPEKNKNVQVPETNLLPVLHISCLYLRCWFIARQNYITLGTWARYFCISSSETT